MRSPCVKVCEIDPATQLCRGCFRTQEERDRRDSEREHGALYAAEDAVTIDSSGMSADQVIAEIAALARDRGLA